MEVFMWTLFIIILVDGIKLLIESFAHGEYTKFDGETKEVSIIIAAHNEEKTILNTIHSVSKSVPMENIFVVDDASTDDTAGVVEKFAPKVNLVTIPHRGKVGAIHSVLQYVKTPYVMLIDADVEFVDGFVIPTHALHANNATAVSFNVVPKVDGDTPFKRFLQNLQLHEYAKSMQIGKRFNNVTKSVHCISGAAGLFTTERLKELAKSHTTIFPGEDLERTLLELDAQGNVIFADDPVYTDVPSTLWSLTRQRVVGWWPGLWRNIWLFLKLILRRKEPFRLRYELLYELFSLITDPIKIVSLVGLIVTHSWWMLFAVYAIYLLLEVLVAWRINALAGEYMTQTIQVMFAYPIYSALQMFYRAFAFFVFVYKKVFTNDWKKVAITIGTIALIGLGISIAKSQPKDDWSVGYQLSRVEDIGKDRQVDNHIVYVGWRSLYTEVSTAPYDRINIGMYHGDFMGEIRYRWTAQDIQTKLQYEHWFGPFVPHVMGGIFYQTADGTEFPIGGLGASYYINDNVVVSVDALKEWGRLYGTTFIGKVSQKNTDIWGTVGVSVTNFGDVGTFGQIGYKWVYLHADYCQHYDYNQFNRMSFGVGAIVTF